MIDISDIASMVRRMDTSATLKNFAAVAAILTTATILIMSFASILLYLADPFDMREPNDALFILSAIVIGVVVSLVPLLFILWDWVARQPWRALAAVNGALIGYLGLAIFGAALVININFYLDDMGELEFAERLLVTIPFGLVTALLATWLFADSRRVRRVAQWIVIGIVVAGMGTSAVILYEEAAFESPRDAVPTVLRVLLVLLSVGVSIFLFARFIRNRIVLAGKTPRGLLLGDFHRRGFWVRLAFLTGLPSSLWHAGAMKTVAFWAFLLARPVVYGGIAFALSENWQSLGVKTQLAGGVGIVISGHVLFYGAKRLATAYAWKPDHPLDGREPVLFLRSFEDDQMKFKRAWWNLPRRWLDLWSFRMNADETLIDEIAQYGPVVALGMPGDKKVPFGAQRYYSSHDDWQDIVTKTAKQARAIVLAAGDTPGVRWEYEMLARERLLDKTVLLFSPTDDTTGSANQRALSAFQEATDVTVDSGLDAAGHPKISLLPAGAGRHALLVSAVADAAAYLTAIRAFFQNHAPQELSDSLAKPARSDWNQSTIEAWMLGEQIEEKQNGLPMPLRSDRNQSATDARILDEQIEQKLNGLPMPRPLADPLLSIARLYKGLEKFGLFLFILIVIVILIYGLDPEGVDLFVTVLVLTFVTFLSFSLGLPDRKVNALYLRSFKKDSESELIREHLEIALGPDFRLSGIRDPHKRMNYVLRPFMLMIMIIKYASARHLGLEAGTDWKARIWASLMETRLVFLDLSELTKFVKEEIRLSVDSMPLRNIIFIEASPVNEQEWKKAFCDEYGLAGQAMDQLQLAVWDRNGGSNKNFIEQVRQLVSNAEAEPEARLVKSYELVSDSILTKGEIRSEKTKKWIQIVVGTLLVFSALALSEEIIWIFPDPVLWAIELALAAFVFYVILQLVIGTRIKHRKLSLAKRFSPSNSQRYVIDLVKTYALLFLMTGGIGFTVFNYLMDGI